MAYAYLSLSLDSTALDGRIIVRIDRVEKQIFGISPIALLFLFYIPLVRVFYMQRLPIINGEK